MNKMINKNIYEGSNPVFESILKQSGLYEQEKKTLDPVLNIISALNTLFTMILDSKMENYKSPQEFESSLGNKIISANDLMSFKSAIMPVVKTLAVSDPENKQYAEQNVKFIEANLAPLDKALKSAEEFQNVKEKIKEVVDGFKVDLQNRANDLKKTKEIAVKESSITEQQGKTGDETNVQYGQFEGPAFDRSKEAIDAALAFTGEVTRDKYNKSIASDTQIQKFEGIANDLLKQARDIQLVDRKGLKIITAEGTTHKKRDYKLKVDSLINEIIRQKKEYRRVRDLVLSNAQTSYVPAPVPVVVKPTVEPVKDETQPKKEDSKASCTFPVKIGSAKCDEIVKLQTKIMDLFPAIAKFLESRGKADGRYGKGTSKCVNIILGYLNRTKEISLVGDLTKDGYDSIMALEEKDILRKGGAVVKESINLEEYYKNRIFEAEYNEGVPVLRFESFAKTVTSNYPPVNEDDDKNLGFKIPEECLNKSIDSGEIDLDCIKGGKKDEVEEGEKIITREEWKGLKYVNTHSYPISFDESLLSAWGKEAVITAISFAIPGTGYIAKAGSISLKGLAIRNASSKGAEKLAQRLAVTAAEGTLSGTKQALLSKGGKELAGTALKTAAKFNPGKVANALSKLSGEVFAEYGKVLIPKRTAAGLIGGAIGGSVVDFLSGRNSYLITVTEGYIDKNNLLGVVTGLIDTIDGYVSDEDWATIASVISVIKGSFTIDEGKAISSWEFIKNKYQSAEGESIIDDINSVKPKMGDVEGFPKLKSASPLSSLSVMAWGFAKDEVTAFVSKLESNEAKLKENISKLPKNYLEALEEGNFVEYDEEGNLLGIDIESEESDSEEE